MKIVGYTVGTPLPKPNFDQTDPYKGDYIKGDRSFITTDETLTQSGRPAEAKATGDAINNLRSEVDERIDESKLFIATYGATTYQDIVDAVNAGRVVQAKSEGDIICNLISCDEEACSFIASIGVQVLALIVDNSNAWSEEVLSAAESEHIHGIEDVVDLSDTITTLETNYNESIIGLSVDGRIVTYIKGDGSVHTFETQDTNTTYSLGTDEVTGLTKLYATIGSAEDGTMTQKAIKTELDKKVGVTVDTTQNALVFTI